MSPIYLNPQHSSSIPFLELKGDQQHGLQFVGYAHDLATSNCFSYSNLDSHHNESLAIDYSRHAQEKITKLVLSHGKPDDLSQVLTSNSSWPQSPGDGSGCSYAPPFDHREGDRKIEPMDGDQKYSKKWKPSKIRITHKMVVTSNKNTGEHKLHHDPSQRQRHRNNNSNENNNNGMRVCTDCHTTTTPLWRSGPQGPKSLCNACGIRQRKARRAAMAAAAAAAGFAKDGIVASSSISSSIVEAPKPKVEEMRTTQRGIDDDKSHTLLPLKKRSKTIDFHNKGKNKLSFEDFALSSNKNYITTNSQKRVFPQDEEEGAMLLMALSCGLACST